MIKFMKKYFLAFFIIPAIVSIVLSLTMALWMPKTIFKGIYCSFAKLKSQKAEIPCLYLKINKEFTEPQEIIDAIFYLKSANVNTIIINPFFIEPLFSEYTNDLKKNLLLLIQSSFNSLNEYSSLIIQLAYKRDLNLTILNSKITQFFNDSLKNLNNQFNTSQKKAIHDFYLSRKLFFHSLIPAALIKNPNASYLLSSILNNQTTKTYFNVSSQKHFFEPYNSQYKLFHYYLELLKIKLDADNLKKTKNKIIFTKKGHPVKIINYQENKIVYIDNFHHKNLLNLDFSLFSRMSQYEDKIISALKILDSAGYLNLLSTENPLFHYENSLKTKNELLRSNDISLFPIYQKKKELFEDSLHNIIKQNIKEEIINEIDQLLDQPQIPQLEHEKLSSTRKNLYSLFSDLENNFDQLKLIKKNLNSIPQNSICLFPFINPDKPVNKLSTFFHQNLKEFNDLYPAINALYSGNLINPLPFYYLFCLSVILSLALSCFFYFIPQFRLSLIWAISFLCLSFGALISVFYIFYIDTEFLQIIILSTIILGYLIILKKRFLLKRSILIKNKISSQISAKDYVSLIENPAYDQLESGTRKILTLLHCQIKEIDHFSEVIDSKLFVKLIRFFRSQIEESVFKYSGTIEKYKGSSLSIIFGAPLPKADHALRACKTALEIKEKFPKIQHEFAKTHNFKLPPFNIKFGIVTGEILLANFGTEKLYDYSIFGTAFKKAILLSEINSVYASDILISSDCFREIEMYLLTRPLDKINFSEENKTEKIYQLLGKKENENKALQTALETFENGLYFFQEKNWEEAEKYFKLALNILPKDKTIQIYLKRCHKYKIHPPKSWNGIYNYNK